MPERFAKDAPPNKNKNNNNNSSSSSKTKRKKKVVIIGAGWGGLSAAHALSKHSNTRSTNYEITVIDAAPRVGGLVRDGFPSLRGKFQNAEAGQHGFWDAYYNIFHFLQEDLFESQNNNLDNILTQYAEQGQYSPKGLEAIWPVYRNEKFPKLPTGLAQAAYTQFLNLPLSDRLSALPLALAFAEFDNSPQAWKRYDSISFYDLCCNILGVSQRCYDEAFEPMILTGLFAPGSQCSAAAALGMAYFFVLSHPTAFDVRWCKGNIGEQIFDPWVKLMQQTGFVHFQMSTRVTGFQIIHNGNNDDAVNKNKPVSSLSSSTKPRISKIQCCCSQSKNTTDNTNNNSTNKDTIMTLEADEVIFAVGASALNAMVRNSPDLSQFQEFRRFANLRGTSVLATRLFFDRTIQTPYTANACWGFDKGVGMTFFNIKELHGDNFKYNKVNTKNNQDNNDNDDNDDLLGSVIEVDYYHANSLLVMSDEQIVRKAKQDLDTMLGLQCSKAHVVDAAIVRLPNAVNWYFPDSYRDMPNVRSSDLQNVYFAGDLVKTQHGSWSQEKAFVTGMQAANAVMGKSNINDNVISLPRDEPHVALGRSMVSNFQTLLGGGNKDNAPSLATFLFRR